jgi:hypothetical protein
MPFDFAGVEEAELKRSLGELLTNLQRYGSTGDFLLYL